MDTPFPTPKPMDTQAGIDPMATIYRTPAQEAPHLVTPLPGPKAAAWVARDRAALSPSYTRDYPLVARRGWGCSIEDVDGNVFLDFTAGLAVTSTGHAHPEVVAAITEQAGNLIHMSGTDFYYPAEIELAERLAKLAPGSSPKKVFFTNSGTESVEAAMKLAMYNTGRKRFIAFQGAFHGRTLGSLSLCASKAIHRRGYAPLLAGTHWVTYDCPRSEIEKLFATVAPPEEVAAIFVEPVQGEGGYRVPSAEFLPMLRELCDEHGILLAADEVQTGIGRTGRMFALEHFGVEPDLLCVAKGLASGMPIGAMIARERLMNWPPGSHASTFGGNPVCAAAALATLGLVEREYLDNARQRGEQLKAGLDQLAEAHRHLSDVRGLGLMVAVDVVAAGAPCPHRRDAMIQSAFQRGLLLVGCGKSAVRFCPGLCVTSSEITTALRIFAQVCAE